MDTFEGAADRALSELRARLIADAKARAAGGCSSGGIRRVWAAYVRQLAWLRASAPPGAAPRS